MRLTSAIWSGSLGGSVPSSAYDPRMERWRISLLIELQIRIVKDTHAHEKPNKKKKPHRGYAFVVFEREKDMRGKTTPFPTPTITAVSGPWNMPGRCGPQACPLPV